MVSIRQSVIAGSDYLLRSDDVVFPFDAHLLNNLFIVFFFFSQGKMQILDFILAVVKATTDDKVSTIEISV